MKKLVLDEQRLHPERLVAAHRIGDVLGVAVTIVAVHHCRQRVAPMMSFTAAWRSA